MPILRHQPGDNAPVSTTYVLVGHYGESTDFAIWCNAGDRLPFVSIAGNDGPYWYVGVAIATADAQAA